MKKYYLILLSLVIGTDTLASSQKEQYKKEKSLRQSSVITIRDNGVKRVVKIPSNENKTPQYQSRAKKIAKKEGLLVRFKKVSTETIEKFEVKYQVKLKKKLRIGYYIFDNLSKYSDIQVLRTILQDADNIKSIQPNWKLQNQPM